MPAYSARYEAALVLAIRAHQTQVRKGTDIPYASHPVHVSVILQKHGYPDDLAVAGLLHDVVEDQDVPIGAIESEFGPAVAEMVLAVTELKSEGGIKRPWRTRKEEALAHMRAGGPAVAALKAADVLHNVHSLAAQLQGAGASAWSHFSRGPEDTLWYYRSVADLAREHLGPVPLVEELAQAVSGVERIVAGMEGARHD
ncbi:MAG TPA: HD domain-containing protein [Anaerolineae bacterium]|nr:HD domain-containing protein [Anaerolineae bacterium]